jgi:hypothetical protein
MTGGMMKAITSIILTATWLLSPLAQHGFLADIYIKRTNPMTGEVAYGISTSHNIFHKTKPSPRKNKITQDIW